MMLTALLLLLSLPAQGAPTSNLLSTDLEWDPTVMIGLGYGRVVPVAPWGHDRDLLLHGRLSTPMFMLGSIDHMNLEAGASAPLLDGPWNVGVGLVGRTQWFDNGLSSGMNLAYQVDLDPGHYQERWFVGGRIRLRQVVATHFKHKPLYDTMFVGEPQDGWYSGSSAYLFFLASGGVRVGQRVDLTLRAGVRVAADFGSYAPYLLPWNFSFGARYHFGRST